MILPIIVAIIVIIVDQVIKYWTVNNIPLNESMSGIAGLFDFYYLQNDGAGWGLFSGRLNLFYLVTLVVVAYLFYLIFRNRHHARLTRFSYGLLLGGAIGNFIDRLRLGYVIDMFRLSFIHFPVFNIADAALTIGIMILLVVILFNLDAEDVL